MTDQEESDTVEQMAAALEAEGLAASEPQVHDPGTLRTGNSPEFGLGGPLPLDDLRARLQACVEAGVTSYRDGALELKFDPDARKGAKQTGGEITSF